MFSTYGKVKKEIEMYLFVLVIMVICLFLTVFFSKERKIIKVGLSAALISVGWVTFLLGVDIPKKKAKSELIHHYDGKIPINGQIQFKTTYCFKNGDVTKIVFDGKCPK